MKIYYKRNCGSSKRALEWFRTYNIDIDMLNIRKITQDDLIQVLSLSDNGIFDIIKRSVNVTSANNKIREKINNMSFNEAVIYLSRNPNILITPIIIEKNRCLIGFNSDKIRQFFPKEYRKYLLERDKL